MNYMNYQRLCAGTPASVWEAELPAPDPRDAAEGKTRIVRVTQDAVQGCGHPVKVAYVGQSGADPEDPDARRLFVKGASVVTCPQCDRAQVAVPSGEN